MIHHPRFVDGKSCFCLKALPLTAFFLFLSLSSPLGSLHAAPIPDAGTLMQVQPKSSPQLPVESAPALSPEVPAATEEKAGPLITVKAFRIVGSKAIAESELQAQLVGYVGKEYSFKQLQAIAMRLVGHYVQKGYLTRVFIAPQEFTDGTVTYTVVEGKVGSLSLTADPTAKRIDAPRLERMLNARVTSGELLSLQTLGEATNILNNQPGVKATATLKPGNAEGGVDIAVLAADTPLATYTAQVNNTGSRATGLMQATGSTTLNNPTGHFDQASLLANLSEGIAYGSADYSIALGNRGLRLGVNGSYMDYRITQSSLSSLDAHGTAGSIGLYGSYPIMMQTQKSLIVSGGLNQKSLTDYALGAQIDYRIVTDGNITLSGSWNNGLIPGFVNYTANLVVGRVDLTNNPDALLQDQATRNTSGSFTKLTWRVTDILSLGRKWSMLTNLRGQFADQNLDTSEQFTLGGLNAVRAYPVGEAFGDEGWLLSVDVMRPVTDKLNVKLFVDYGQITLNHNTWTGWNAYSPGLPNNYALSAAGVGADWKVSSFASITATLAVPLTSNPGRNSNNRNTDGTPNNGFASLGLNTNF